jgi:hypothetical protein
MTAMSRLATSAAALVLAGCAAAPVQAPVAPPPALVMSSGMVIGTLSYQYVETGERGSGATWLVHFERIDAPSSQDYVLAVDVDAQRQQGVFTGALPAGVYAFREVASDKKHFRAGALKMPFEVQPGEVRDAGHYALKPLDGI